jgi:NAD(P)-dependent dehydrogenase (short-subunit alcohol dehydrogenase family)
MVMTDSNGDIGARLAHYRALFDLNGKTAVVLGAASGIGKASAEALAALGASVICADKDRAGVERIARELGGEAHVVDAGSADDVARLAAAAATAGRVDIAVTTPAMHIRKWFLDYSDDEFDRIVSLNLRGCSCSCALSAASCAIRAAAA